MKKIMLIGIEILLLGIALALMAAPSFAVGVDLTVNACPSSPSASSDAGALDCAGGQLLTLYLTFQPAEPISELSALTTYPYVLLRTYPPRSPSQRDGLNVAQAC